MGGFADLCGPVRTVNFNIEMGWAERRIVADSSSSSAGSPSRPIDLQL
jgi:hypothetical protein